MAVSYERGTLYEWGGAKLVCARTTAHSEYFDSFWILTLRLQESTLETYLTSLGKHIG